MRNQCYQKACSMQPLVAALLQLDPFCALAAETPDDLSETRAWAVSFLLAGAVLVLAVQQLRHGLNKTVRVNASRLRTLSQYTSETLLETSSTFEITYAGYGTKALLGHTPQEILGKNVSELVHPGSLPLFSTLVETIRVQSPEQLIRSANRRYEFDIIHKSNVACSISCIIVPSLDRKGKIKGYVLLLRDITDHKRTSLALEVQKLQLQKLLEEQTDAELVVSPEGLLLFHNTAAHKLFGDKIDTLRNKLFGIPSTSEDATEIMVMGADGMPRPAQMRHLRIEWEGNPACLLSLRDVTYPRRIEEELKLSQERYHTVAEYTYDWESWVSPEGNVLYASPSCERITGYEPKRFLESRDFLQRIIHPEDVSLWEQHMQAVRTEGTASELDFRIHSADGQIRWISQTASLVFNSEGSSLGIRCSMRDITNRVIMEQQLRELSLHDSLTGLGNRTLCLERIKLGQERARRRSNYHFAVVFLGLDRFKLINENYGHTLGDKVLVEISRRLVRATRALDTVARFGGDEFVLLLEELNSPRESFLVINRVLESLEEPMDIDGNEIRVNGSLGLVPRPSSDVEPAELLRNANIAMYRAKETGKSRYKIYNPGMAERVRKIMTLEHDMRRALNNNEYYLVFQPIMRLRSGKLDGFEALLRWNHPERGVIPPGEFIPMAEENGFIVELGAWVLQEACTVLASWEERFPESKTQLSVNISARQFAESGLFDMLHSTLQRTHTPVRRLKLELTETTVMQNADQASQILTRLKQLGLSLSIDDFGTGYSSLSYLQRFPLDNLKIDLSFVRMLDNSPENIEIIKAIVNLAHNLGLDVVAEGIEKESQERLLRSLGCDLGQGYLYARPLPQEEAEAFMLAQQQDSGA